MAALTLTVAASGALAGCDDGGGVDQSDTGPVTLVYWTSQNPQERAWADTLVARWNATHEVQVVAQPIPAGQSSEEVLLAAVVAGTTPDLCSNIWPGVLNDFVRAGGVLALDEMAGFDSLYAARVPPALAPRFVSGDGHVYQMPWKTNPILMLTNTDLFESAGVDVPRTYAEYLAAAERITADTDGDGQTDRWMGSRDIRPIWWQRYFDVYPLYLAASGGQTFFDSDAQLDVDRQALADVFGFFQTLYGRGYFPLSTLQGNAFAQGRVATEFTGPWTAAWLVENAPDIRFEFAPVPVPDGLTAERPVTYGDYKNIAVFSTTRHPAEALAFVAYLVSPEADRLLFEMTGQVPVRAGLLDDPELADLFDERPYLRRFAEQAPHTRGVDAVPSLPETLDAIAQSYERAIYGAQTPDQAVASAVDRIGVIQTWAR